MSSGEATHPFKSTADPAAYVPRAETEAVLDNLNAWLASERPAVSLLGPPGLGKTLLLRVFANRLPSALPCGYVASAAVEPEELPACLLASLGTATSSDPISALTEMSERNGLILLIDEAQSIPEDSRIFLRNLIEDIAGLRLVFAGETSCSDWIGDIHTDTSVLHLDTTMSAAETADYMQRGLSTLPLTDPPRARFDDALITELHESSQGIPRQLNRSVEAHINAARGLQVPASALSTPVPMRSKPPITPEPSPQPEPKATTASNAEGEIELKPARKPEAETVKGPIAYSEPYEINSESKQNWPRMTIKTLAIAASLATVTLLWTQLRERWQAEQEAVVVPPEPVVVRSAIDINARPWASIKINGAYVGITPLSGLVLEPGSHRIQAELPDGTVLERIEQIGTARRGISFP